MLYLPTHPIKIEKLLYLPLFKPIIPRITLNNARTFLMD